jgi:hypothetical protein
MAVCAYNIVNMLPTDPKKARAVLKLADEFVDEVAERACGCGSDNQQHDRSHLLRRRAVAAQRGRIGSL